MADQVREVRTETHQEGPVQVNRKAVSESSADRPVIKLQQVVYFLYSVLATLLILHIILSLFGANRSNGFANFIYNVSNPFVAPFRGLFGYKTQYGVSRFEIESVIALIVYGLVAWLLIRLFELMKRHPETI